MAKYRVKRFIARLLFLLGFKPHVSTGIHGGLTYGWGELSPNGFWEYELWVEKVEE